MAVTGEQLHRMTENVYRHTAENFAPEIRTLINLAKIYEKAQQGVCQAAKEYFDAIIRVGELASETKGARQLGQSMLQIAETYRQIEAERSDTVRAFRKELLLPVESKIENEWKTITHTQKIYMNENKTKAEAVEKCRNEVKKIQKKTQKNHSEKYIEKEQKCVEELNHLSKSLLKFRSQGLREAWGEQRRRYAFLVERYCLFIKTDAAYHSKSQSVLHNRLAKWNETCEKPYQLPMECEELLSVDFSGPLETPLQLELRNSLKLYERSAILTQKSLDQQSKDGSESSSRSDEIQRPLSVEVDTAEQATEEQEQPPPPQHQPPPPQQQYLPQHHQGQPGPGAYISSTLPNRGRSGGLRHTQSMISRSGAPASLSSTVPHHPYPRRVSDSADDREKSGMPKVQALYGHPGTGDNQLSFNEGDMIGLIGPKNNGWYYGHNFRSKRNGWFPIGFTQPINEAPHHPNGAIPPPPPSSALPPHRNQPTKINKALSVSSDNLPTLQQHHGENYPTPDYTSNNSNQNTFFNQNPMHPQGQQMHQQPGTQHSQGLLITSSQPSPQPMQASPQSSHSGSGSHHSLTGSGLHGGINGNGIIGGPHPHTPTHPPPQPPFQSSPPAEGEGEENNPMLNVQLRKTVTNDRSAPVIPKEYSM